MHTGYCRPTASPPHAAIQELRATVRVLPPQDCMSLQPLILSQNHCVLSKIIFTKKLFRSRLLLDKFWSHNEYLKSLS